MQKAKKEDFRVEEELRAQKAKYEETSEDVYRRMQDIKEDEVDSVADLGAFLDAELSYYDRCRDVLLQLKRDWPAGSVRVLYLSRIALTLKLGVTDKTTQITERTVEILVPVLIPPTRMRSVMIRWRRSLLCQH